MTRRRIVVAGGTGFFGAAVVGRLRANGLDPQVASRHGPVRLDVEDPSSIRATLREGDVVVDATGPFQARSETLARLSDEIGFDVVDLSDSLDYCDRLLGLVPRRARILTACSTLSAISAALVERTGIARPDRVTCVLVPEASASSRPAAARSMLRSVGRRIRVLRRGALVGAEGWQPVEEADAGPLGRLTAHRMESADAVMLPRRWPGLRDVDFLVATRMPWLDAAVRAAAVFRLTPLIGWGPVLAMGLWATRRLAPRGSAFLAHVEEEGRRVSVGLVAEYGGHVVAALPAALAAEALATEPPTETGHLPCSRCVSSGRLLAECERAGVRVVVG